MYKYLYQKERQGYSIWSRSGQTGDKKDLLDYASTKKEAVRKILKLMSKDRESLTL